MCIPELGQAQLWLQEAGVLNPGPWVAHSRYVAEAARNIATHLPPPLDADTAYVLGLLHDIGRRGRGYRLAAQPGWLPFPVSRGM